MNDLEFLARVRGMLIERGWTTDTYELSTGEVCIVGAGCLVQHGISAPDLIWRTHVADRLKKLFQLEDNFAHQHPVSLVTHWNDIRVRDFDELLARIDEAIARIVNAPEEVEEETHEEERELVLA